MYTQTSLLHLFIFLPLLGCIITLMLRSKNETMISRVAFFATGLQLLLSVGFVIYWLISDHQTLAIKDIILYKTPDYEFYIDLCFDKITAVYLLVGSFLTFLVTTYCRYYLHRESGYKRFFLTVLFFFMGYNITILSGNFETLFIGWEILGISSFLLIAFYRERYLPVKNAFKVFSIYRIGDVGLIMAMWMSHHLFHENITFLKLSNDAIVSQHLESHTFIGIFISLMILVSAAAKSAQLPFSSWLPRAMEGPTPSSAIFYGSLSVHIGVYLLLRTFPFWEHQFSVRVLIALLGLSTSIIATLIARVQSSVKSQIAYSSIAQIGLIFIEVAAGFEDLALLHFAGNAFLRTYQLLVSPSVVSYLIREQFYNFTPRSNTIEDSLPKKAENTIYLMALKEFNLDFLLYRIIWNPMHQVGNRLNVINIKQLLLFFIPAFIVGLFFLYNEDAIPEVAHGYFPIIFSLFGLLLILKSFVERDNVQMAWLLIILNHFWIALAISFNEHFSVFETLFYLSGVVIAGSLGFVGLRKLFAVEGNITLHQYNGHSFEHPKFAFVFLLACLGLMGFPITPTFIGEDLIFSHIHEDQFVLALITCLSFITAGLAVMRIYARLFLGPHIKTYHETPYKSS